MCVGRVLIPPTIDLNRSHGGSVRQASTAVTMGAVSVGEKHAVSCHHRDGVKHMSEVDGANKRVANLKNTLVYTNLIKPLII